MRSVIKRHTETQVVRQYPQRARRPGKLIIVRSAGGREQTGAFRQARAFSVETDGSARLLSLTHERGGGHYFNKRAFTWGERKVAA